MECIIGVKKFQHINTRRTLDSLNSEVCQIEVDNLIRLG